MCSIILHISHFNSWWVALTVCVATCFWNPVMTHVDESLLLFPDTVSLSVLVRETSERADDLDCSHRSLRRWCTVWVWHPRVTGKKKGQDGCCLSDHWFPFWIPVNPSWNPHVVKVGQAQIVHRLLIKMDDLFPLCAAVCTMVITVLPRPQQWTNHVSVSAVNHNISLHIVASTE